MHPEHGRKPNDECVNRVQNARHFASHGSRMSGMADVNPFVNPYTTKNLLLVLNILTKQPDRVYTRHVLKNKLRIQESGVANLPTDAEPILLGGPPVY
uniref:SFRICE_000907 n=1 Tax=Spodoptera frugiperda TaxID=7108 RepID=A0A2H1VD87_SPOFR